MAHPRLFLNYARGDDESFVRRLHDDLVARGFTVWFDRVSMPSRQLTFHQEIEDAVRKRTDKVVHVAGPRANVSDYVRQEWEVALELDLPVVPLLRLGTFDDVPGQLSLLQCEDFRDDARYAAALERLVGHLDEPPAPLGALIGVPRLPPRFLARPELLRRARDALMVDLLRPVVVSGATGAGAQVGLQGMGGIGKSVVAAAVARDRELRRAYPDGVIWVTVGQQPNLLQLQIDLARRLKLSEAAQIDSVEAGKRILGEALAARALVLVLDDVWETQHAEAFTVLGPRGRVLVTTRDAAILDSLGGESLPVSLFSETEALALLAATASPAGADPQDPAALPPAAREVARECGFLPLGVALCGGMARAGTPWEVMLRALRGHELEAFAQRQMRTGDNPQHQSLWKAMLASIQALGDPDKERRLAELSVFAPDRRVPEAAVRTLWEHTGGLGEMSVENLLRELVERSLVSEHRDAPGAPRQIWLHDLLHDCATRLVGDQPPLHEKLLEAYARRCPYGWASGPADGYFHSELIRHMTLAKKERKDDARQLLLNYRWLAAKLAACGVQAAIDDYACFGQDQIDALDHAREALKLSSHVLGPRPEELASQLLGRLADDAATELRALAAEVRENAPRPALLPTWSNYFRPGGILFLTLQAHDRGVSCLAVNSRGERAISGTQAGEIKVWDLMSGRPISRMQRDGAGGCSAVALSEDGGLAVAAYSDGSVSLWDANSGSLLRTVTGDGGGACNLLALSAEGRSLVAASRAAVMILRSSSAAPTFIPLRHERYDRIIGLSRNGEAALVRSSGEVALWEIQSAHFTDSLAHYEGTLDAAELSDDGTRIVLAASEEELRVVDLPQHDLGRTVPGQADRVSDLALSADGSLAVAGGGSGHLWISDVAAGRVRKSFATMQDGIYSVALDPKGRVALSGGMDGTVRVWNLRATENTNRSAHDGMGSICSMSVAWQAQRFLSASRDGRLDLCDANTGRCLVSFDGQQGEVTATALSPDARWAVSSGADRTVKLWDLTPDRPVAITLETGGGSMAVLQISRIGRRILGCDASGLFLWELPSGRVVRTFAVRHALEEVHDVAISADGRHAAVGTESGRIQFWDLERGKLWDKSAHGRRTRVAIGSNGLAVSGSSDRAIKLWNLSSGNLFGRLDGHEREAWAVAMSENGQWIASGAGDRTVKVWQLAPDDADARSGKDDGKSKSQTADPVVARVIAAATLDAEILEIGLSPDGRHVMVLENPGKLHMFEVVAS
jgi:WD40 repeat protein